MSSFRTELNVAPSSLKIELSDTVFTIGSCFSDSLGLFLQKNKFSAAINPLGVSYSATAIFRLLELAATNGSPSPGGFVENAGVWSHFDFHSKFSSDSIDTTRGNIQSAIRCAHEKIIDAKHLVITFGTSWVFERRSNNELVANCHKLPSSDFEKKLLSADDVLTSFSNLMTRLKRVNPKLNIILTVSPVRHVKDTLELNSLSKSILTVAAHQIIKKFPSVHYFPSFEIMTDDLRDYRFYDADMIHPSPVAIGYICNKFSEKHFTAGTIQFIKTWTGITSALDHRPFQPSSAGYRKFLTDTLEKVEELGSVVNVDEEIRQIRDRLAEISI